MGSSLLEPRRKRKRRLNMTSGIHSSRSSALDKRCVVSLPCVAVLFALAMAVIVGVRKALKESARRSATESRAGRARDNASIHPLAVLLLEQHEIESQAARFADPSRLCLSPGGDEPPSERLGLFTCLADTRFFLLALAKALGFPAVVTVDVGSNPRPPTRGVAFAGGESDLTSDALQIQAHIEARKDPLPDNADLILVEAYGEVLSEAAWEELLRSLLQVLSETGVIIIRGPRQGMTLIANNEEGEEEWGGPSAAWNGLIHLWEAVATLACDSGYRATATVGDLDGGLIVLRHRAPDETGLETGCESSRMGQSAQGGSGSGIAAVTEVNEPRPLRFESLFLWATAERDIGTARAIEAVQAKFGGADAVRRYARRRSDRSACLISGKGGDGGKGGDLSEPFLKSGARGVDGGVEHVRPKRRQIRGNAASVDLASRERYSSTRVCLEDHLREHPQDVRAGFALEMILRAAGGNGVDKHAARLRAKMSEESGAAGALLWRALHARTAGAVATGLLL